MKQLLKLAIFLVGLGLAERNMAGAAGSDGWTPNLEMLPSIEQLIVMPQGAGALGEYDRFYAGVYEGSERLIIGVFVLTDSREGRASVVDRSKLPIIEDGGCSVISLSFDVESRLVRAIGCNGVG